MREIVGRQRNYAEIINQAALNISRADSYRHGAGIDQGLYAFKCVVAARCGS